MEWFADAKFGIFIHWGIYCVPAYDDIKCVRRRRTHNGSEWYLNRLTKTYRVGKSDELTKEHHKTEYKNMPYYDFKNMLTGSNFDADKWCKLFKKIGAKYIVFTSKHHDGFCMWNTKTTQNNIMNTPLNIDVLYELKKSTKKYGLKLGIYYSWMEFNKNITIKFMNNIVTPQLNELLNYAPDLFWFDGDWSTDSKRLDSVNFVDKLHSLGIIVNDRLGKDCKNGDYNNFSDRFIPEKKMKKKFECCYTIGYSWGYNKMQEDGDYKSVDQLYDTYKKVTKHGGNLLLNLCVDKDGNFDKTEYERLIGLSKRIK